MNSILPEKIFAAISRLLRPLVRLLLRNSISSGMFADICRWVYVDVALRDFSLPGRKQTNSRISVLTGLSRKEVLRLRRLETPHDREAMSKYNRAVRVISGWRRDPRFSKKHGKPLDLTFDKGDVSFAELVKAYSGDIPARAMLDELIRTRSVEKLDNGSIRLLTESYIPHEEDDVRISILGSDVAHLLSTIDHNLYSDKGAPRFQRKVSYDNIPEEILEEFKKISARKSQHLLEELDRWLAERDRDLNPEVTGTGRKRVGLGIFYFEDDFENETTVNNDSGEKK